jgi:carbonic anhydrase
VAENSRAQEIDASNNFNQAIKPMKIALNQIRICRLVCFSIQLMVWAAIGAGCGTTGHTVSQTQTKATQSAMTPAAALANLKAGNERFAEGRPIHRDLSVERRATASGQFPFAVVLSCLDSRCSSEQVFDQGIGDIFSARVAGNVLNDDILGSMEFACKVAGARLVVVVGHTSCGAIAGACNHVELGNLTGLLQRIQPAVNSTLAPGQKPDPVQVDAVARANVQLVVKQIRERSPILAGMLQNGQIALVGGMYDLETGHVKFFD